MNKKQVLAQVEVVVQEAGTLLLNWFQRGLERSYKKDGSFATQADLESERFLVEKLKKIVPGAGFFAEESGKVAGNEYCWVIDPLDGTTNFAQGLPYFCISVALTQQNEPILGVIFQPVLKELFSALKGQGAFLNGQHITVSSPQRLDQSFAVVAFPYQRDEETVQKLLSVAHRAYAFRKCGAAALDQAYCAAGRFDLTLFSGLSWWDVAAGMLLIQEAGGLVQQFDGSLVGPEYRSFLAGNKPVCQEVKALMVHL